MNFEEKLEELRTKALQDPKPSFVRDRCLATSDALENRDEYEMDPPVEAWSYADANLVSSLVCHGSRNFEAIHKPVLDIDFPAHLEPSSTPGHFHLYLQKDIPWSKYVLLLSALGAAGILEPGYVAACIAQEQSYVRRPGVKKGE